VKKFTEIKVTRHNTDGESWEEYHTIELHDTTEKNKEEEMNLYRRLSNAPELGRRGE